MHSSSLLRYRSHESGRLRWRQRERAKIIRFKRQRPRMSRRFRRVCSNAGERPHQGLFTLGCAAPAGLLAMQWVYEQGAIDWTALSELYRIAPLGDKKPSELQLVFSNSRYKCFVLEDGSLIGAGRALADGIDCSYLCDIAVHPEFQGRGLGREITMKLTELSAGHKKIILYANPGTESFYEKLGYRRMKTAMAIFSDQERAIRTGLVEGD